MGKLFDYWRYFTLFISLPVILRQYLDPDTGAKYGITIWDKFILGIKILQNRKAIQTASHPVGYLIMASHIWQTPPATDGVIVECGSFKGGSTANLSLIANLCNRELHVFDSFEGLPEPGGKTDGRNVADPDTIGQMVWEEGDYRGEIEEVKSNVREHGCLNICKFHKGFFEDTMTEFDEDVVFAFADVDLRESYEDCIENLWPLLDNRSSIFVHEAKNYSVSALFYDEDWWQESLEVPAPGLVGAGDGIGIRPSPGGFDSYLGFAKKP